MTAHITVADCRICGKQFDYYTALGKQWTCCPEHEAIRKVNARNAAGRAKPKQQREELRDE